MNMEYRELLLEIGCEEMPASWIPGIKAQLAERLSARLDEVRIERRTPVRTFVAPRRLVATVAELAERQSDLEETVTGPPVPRRVRCERRADASRARFRAQAGRGRHGVGARGDLQGGISRLSPPAGRGTTRARCWAASSAATLRDLAFPKAMRWDAILEDGRGEFLFGRPVRWLVFLYASAVVPFEIGRNTGC